MYIDRAQTFFFFYSNLFPATSTSKYSLVLSDFNANHHAWDDLRIDGQYEFVIRAYNAHGMVILNEGSSNFISFSGSASSTIDLSIASRNLAIYCSHYGIQSSCSDHFPINITVLETKPSFYRFSHRLNLSESQLASLHQVSD